MPYINLVNFLKNAERDQIWKDCCTPHPAPIFELTSHPATTDHKFWTPAPLPAPSGRGSGVGVGAGSITSLKRGHLPPFNWKLFKFGSVSVRDIWKNVPILQVGGSALVPPTSLVLRLVLLHKKAFVWRLFSSSVCNFYVHMYHKFGLKSYADSVLKLHSTALLCQPSAINKSYCRTISEKRKKHVSKLPRSSIYWLM